MSWKLAPLVCSLAVGACLQPPVESPVTTVTQETPVRVEQSIKNKVDILFMVDDSPSMAPKQAQLIQRLPQLIQVLEDFGAQGNPAWYHIGVVSSDLGAGPTTPSLNCRPGGKGAKLNTLNRCPRLVPTSNGDLGCDPTAQPIPCNLGGNKSFIDFNQLDGTNNLPPGKSLADTFGCIAATGDTGCGFEHQLESPYRALHDVIPENAGFFRNGPDDNALLVVVWVSDEDDCSADPNTDLFNFNLTSMYGLDLSYRCTQYGIQCDGDNPPDPRLMRPPYGDSGGPLTGCQSRPPTNYGKLIDINKYITYFTKPASQNGVKADPRDVILVSITAPTTPFASIVGDPDTYGPCNPVGAPLDPIRCAVLLQHSCFAPAPLNTVFFGDPGVRFHQVVSAALNHNETSICETDYTSALQALGALIVSQIGPGCLSSPVVNKTLPDGSTAPDCVVEDVTDRPDGTQSIAMIPSCVENGNTPTCWALVQNDKCAVVKAPPDCTPQQFGVKICRDAGCTANTALIPANTTAHVFCATVAHSTNACP
jgi:hypothetical protein